MADVTDAPQTFVSKVTFSAGTVTKISTDDVTSTPTDAELDTAFGTPATVGAGFVAVLDDAGAETASWLVWSTGTAWFFAAGTKAA